MKMLILLAALLPQVVLGFNAFDDEDGVDAVEVFMEHMEENGVNYTTCDNETLSAFGDLLLKSFQASENENKLMYQKIQGVSVDEILTRITEAAMDLSAGINYHDFNGTYLKLIEEIQNQNVKDTYKAVYKFAKKHVKICT